MVVCVCSWPDEIPTPSTPIEPSPWNRLRPHIIAVLLLSVIIFWQVVVHSFLLEFFCFFWSESPLLFLIATEDNDIRIIGMLSLPLSIPPNAYFMYLLLLYSDRNWMWKLRDNGEKKANMPCIELVNLKQHMMGHTMGVSLSSGSKCHLIGKYWFSNSHLLLSSHQSGDSAWVLVRIPLHRSWLTVSISWCDNRETVFCFFLDVGGVWGGWLTMAHQ